MPFSRTDVSALCAATVLSFAPFSSAAPAASQPGSDDPINLDPIVISAGLDHRSAFDLAQGTSSLLGDALQRSTQSTLGETLNRLPAVNSTYFGPGASRPIIRGMGGDRIRVLTGGIGALDASNVSPDHAVALEPLFASRIEVLRGPSALLYGGSAVGGAVNVIDNRIPEIAGDGAVHGSIETRGLGADDARTGVVALGAGTAGFALQLDALRRTTGDLAIPGVARIDPEAPALQPHGTLPNSDSHTTDVSLGGTMFWSGGRIGLGIHRFLDTYGVPVGEPVTIDMAQTRIDLDAVTTTPFGLFSGAVLRAGIGRYNHRELDEGTPSTRFANDAWEGRLELPHEAGRISGTLGAQASGSDFSAVGEEVATPPSTTRAGALFAVEEWKRDDTWSLQFGGRLEHTSVTLGSVPDDLPELPGANIRTGKNRTFTAASGSFGVVLYPARDYSVALGVAATQRAPTAQELFSHGPHGGTNAYEFGTTSLDLEQSLGLDLSVRKRSGRVTGSVSAFANRFGGYIHEQRLPDDAIPTGFNPEGLTPYQFVSGDALFTGGEIEVLLHLVERESSSLHLHITSDYVRAENSDTHTPLPRTPPLRLAATLLFHAAGWQASLGARHAARQDRVAPDETGTPGHTLLEADLAYTWRHAGVSWKFFLSGRNLLNTEARVATSFLKEFAPLPGRSVTVGVRTTF